MYLLSSHFIARWRHVIEALLQYLPFVSKLPTWGFLCEGKTVATHHNAIKWIHVPRYWQICAGNSPVTGEFPTHKSQWRGALIFFVCAWINDWGWWFETPSNSLWRHCNASWWTTNRGVGDLRSPWLMWYHHMVWIKPIYISLFRAAF